MILRLVIFILTGVATQLWASEFPKWTCVYQWYGNQKYTLHFDDSNDASTFFIKTHDSECGDITRNILLTRQGESLYFILHDRGGMGGMDCERIDEDLIRLRIDPNARGSSFDAPTIGKLHCLKR